MSNVKNWNGPGSPRAWLLGGAVVLGAAAMVAASSGRSGSAVQRVMEGTTREAIRAAATGPVPESALTCVDELRLERGQTVEGALLAAGLDRNAAVSVLSGFGDLVDLRRVRPRDRFRVFRSREGDVQRVEYQARPEERVVVEPADGGYAGHLERARVQYRVRKLAGSVDGNLYLSLTAAGGDPALVVDFADLFSWDFDFFTDTRNGDRFELLVQERVVDGEPAGFGRILAGRYSPLDAAHPLEAYYYAWGDGRDEDGYYQADGRSVRKFFLKSPLNYRRISSFFTSARYHPILKKVRPHLGVDYAAPLGTPVVALGSGKVVDVSWHGGFGRTIKLRHNATYLTQYAHLSRYAKGIRSGAHVHQGDVIGYVGMSGLATGPHLDFRVQQNGRWINPLSLPGGESEPLPSRYRPGFDSERSRAESLLRSLSPGQATPFEDSEGTAPALAGLRLDTPRSS